MASEKFVLTPQNKTEQEDLMRLLWSDEIRYDPLKAVLVGFPWGKKHTPLEGIERPRMWQCNYLAELRDYYAQCREQGIADDIFKKAMTSGRGPGKSALVGMLNWFMMTTRVGGSCIVTANTETQLTTKTMPEISKWFRMAINSHWFAYNALSIRPAPWFADLISKDPRYGGMLIEPTKYIVSAQLWSAENPNAFAGEHNMRGEVYTFDEGDGIPDPIWQVTEGVFTERMIDKYWFVFSNPRSNTGAFYECFHKNRDDWRPQKLDTRTVPEVSSKVYDAIIKKYGADSNEAKIEIYGEFPDSTDDQFFDIKTIRDATEREIAEDEFAPLLMGVDIARSEKGDRTVFAFRKGRDARSIPWQVHRGMNAVQTQEAIKKAIDKYNPDHVFIDGGSIGGAVIDNLRAAKYRVIEVQAGSRADDPTMFDNKRIEMAYRCKEWMEYGGCLPENMKDLVDDFKGMKLRHHKITGKMLVESKEDMKKRGLASPDIAEALFQTFAYKVAVKRLNTYNKQELNYPYLGVR